MNSRRGRVGQARPSGTAIVIGGGVVGVCAAYFLQRDGWQVTLLERGSIGEGCSFGNAGLIVPSHIIPLAAPGVWRKGLGWLMRVDSPFRIKPRLDWRFAAWLLLFWRSCSHAHVERSLPILRAMTYESLRLFDELADVSGFSFGYTRSGMLTVYRTRKAFEAAQIEAQLLRDAGVPARTLTAADTEAFEPYLMPGVAGSVLFEDDASIIPDAFVKGLADVAAREGVVILPATEVTHLEVKRDRVVAVVTHAEPHSADEIIIAAGAETPTLGRPLGIRLPIESGKGYSMTFERSGVGPRLPLMLGEAKVSITPLGGRVRFSGTLELGGREASVDRYRAGSILRAAGGWVKDAPVLDTMPVWTGLRPCTPDGLPMIGRPSGLDNVIVAAGHAMLGVSLGPVTGAIVADLAAHRPSAVPVAALHPDRF